jgi:hypothetical protein
VKCPLTAFRRGINLETKFTMSKRIILFLIILAFVKQSLAEESTELMGTWMAQQTYCNNPNTQSMVKTLILNQPWLGFEPQVRLKIYAKDGKQYIQKDVEKKSCFVNNVDTEYFITSTHEVEISSSNKSGQTIHAMNAKKFESGEIRNMAFLKCGPILKSILLLTGTHYKYSYLEYFQQESSRAYHLYIRDGKMYLIFNEPEICKDSNTIMVFNKE